MNKIHRWGIILAFLVILASAYFAVRTVFIEDKSATVPKMVGMQLVDAVDALQREGLLAKIDQVDSPLRADTVVSQNLPEGEKVARGKVVVLRVSKGGALLPLPDVRGLKFEEGVNKLAEAGFKVSNITRVTDKFKPAGTIIAQNPAAPQQLSATSMVSLLVSSGPTDSGSFINVPDLRGQRIDVARNILEQSDLLVGKTTESPSAEVPAGTVISTSPNRGARVQSGAQVNIIIARALLPEELSTEATTPRSEEPIRTVIISETPESKAPQPPTVVASPEVTPPSPEVTTPPAEKPEAPVTPPPSTPKKTAKVRYQVPPLSKPLPLKIEISDGAGKRVLRDSQTPGGEFFSMDVPYEDEAVITIFLGGEFVWQDKFK